MTTTIESNSTLQIATFHVGDLLLGVSISEIQEINRHLDATSVPHSRDSVRGVINLRGEVVTVTDVRTLLGLPRQEITSRCRCVVIHSQDELIGLLVDRIADILTVSQDRIAPTPANIEGVECRYIHGVYTLDSGVVVLLDVDQLLATC